MEERSEKNLKNEAWKKVWSMEPPNAAVFFTGFVIGILFSNTGFYGFAVGFFTATYLWQNNHHENLVTKYAAASMKMLLATFNKPEKFP